ncbi:DNA-binding protein Alba [Candidatus Altiarchaeales archaeon WOR_SM1_SCG]|nr:DNA-binding protein Alba [Candidatus Altiarchaeales archaeon WOR_SM1_SCG]
MAEKINETGKKKDDNVIFVGKKGVMAYVLATVTQFNESDEVVIKARGRSINRAVDVAEIVRNRFVVGAVPSVEIGTEEIKGDDGTVNVSTIEITLTKI